MTLYNLKSALDDYRITKFTQDLDVESSYLMDSATGACECPAGERRTCRHRQILPWILPIIDTEWFWHFERSVIVDCNGDPTPYLAEMEASIDRAKANGFIPLADIVAVSLDEPATLHNAVANAVGEPTTASPAKSGSWRRI
jgi:hypothetical protein